MNFRFRQLQCFLTLSDLLNFSATARALELSQSTVTFQIQSLERSFGVELFKRNRKRVELTAMGSDLLGFARSMMDSMVAAQAQIGPGPTDLPLRVGCGSLAPLLLLPQLLRMLGSRHPGFKLEVTELSTREQIDALTHGRLDALLLVQNLPVPGIRFDPLCLQAPVAAVSCHSPLAAYRSLSVHDLCGVPILTSRMSECHLEQRYLRAMMSPFGITPTFIDAPHTWHGQLAYASAGKGVAITVAAMSSCRFAGVIFLPFREELPPFEMGISSRPTGDSFALRLFKSVARECAADVFAPAL